jgi:broad specificity phosphatase PhoE
VLIMGAIYLVRHGQAAFGTDDYDRLTEIGYTQARLLGGFLAVRQVRCDAIYTGTLRRHTETVRGILDGGPAIGDGSAVESIPGLDEYKAEALIASLMGDSFASAPIARRDEPGLAREHFRRLRAALLAWTEGRIQPAGMPDWRMFQAAAVAALVEARRRHSGGNVLVVSSGGPIAAIVAAALESPPQIAVELNLRIRNSAVTEFTMSARRHQLLSFNALPHLEAQSDATLVTYA